MKPMSIFKRKSAPLEVSIPKDKGLGLSSRVGLIAAVGFALGVAWPRLLGLEVGPQVPGGKAKAAAAAASAAPAASAAAAPPPTDDPPEVATIQNKQLAIVGDGVQRDCRNTKGEKQPTCGKVKLDKQVRSKLENLAACPSAIGLEGKLMVGLAVNFEKSTIAVIEDEKSSLPGNTVKGVLKCAADELKNVELDKVTRHEPRVTIAFPIAFYPPGKSPEPEPAPGEQAAQDTESKADRATVSWEKALLRESPKDGKVVARVAQGTRVVVVEQKDDWYLVESGKSRGWVYRQAIGK